MPLTILSPHNARPVLVREQDLARAVRDSDGKIFYVLPRSTGQGHYASITRTGSPAEEQRYLQLQSSPDSSATPHNAAGSPPLAQSGIRGRILILIFILAMLGVVALWLFTVGPLGHFHFVKPPPPNQPIEEMHRPTTTPATQQIPSS